MTSEPPHASSWATPPEFYPDENIVTRSVCRLLTGLGYSVHTPPNCSAAGRHRLARPTRSGLAVLPGPPAADAGRSGHALEDRSALSGRPLSGVINALLRHVCASLRDRVDDAFAAQHFYCLPGGAARDAVPLLQVALRRQGRAQRQFPALDLPSDDRGQLLVDRDRVVMVYLTLSHLCHAR